MVSGKTEKYQQKQVLNLSFSFSIKNVAFCYALFHLENCFFLLYVCFKIVTCKTVVSPINWNIVKNTALNTKGPKREIKRINMKMTQISHFNYHSQPVFTCSKPIIKTERPCPKYDQRPQERQRIKCVKLRFCNGLVFQDFDFSPLFYFITSIAILCRLYLYTYVSALILSITTLISSYFSYIPPRFPAFTF